MDNHYTREELEGMSSGDLKQIAERDFHLDWDDLPVLRRDHAIEEILYMQSQEGEED